jgi:uncharacterized protein YkwD
MLVAVSALVPAQGAFGVQQTAQLVASPAACPGSRSTVVTPAARRAAFLCLLNHARRTVGRSPLRPSGALARVAHAKGSDVARCDDFSHEACGADPFLHVRASGLRVVKAGENLYLGERPRGSALDVLVAWLESPSHRRVMLADEFSHAGAAVLEVERLAGARTVSLWVLELARTR